VVLRGSPCKILLWPDTDDGRAHGALQARARCNRPDGCGARRATTEKAGHRTRPALATGVRRLNGPKRTPSSGGPTAGTPLIMATPERTLGSPGGALTPPALAWRRAGQTEPNPGEGPAFVPVAVACAVVPVVVVPGTAPEDAAGGGQATSLGEPREVDRQARRPLFCSAMTAWRDWAGHSPIRKFQVRYERRRKNPNGGFAPVAPGFQQAGFQQAGFQQAGFQQAGFQQASTQGVKC
jgi:hypothetical protein